MSLRRISKGVERKRERDNVTVGTAIPAAKLCQETHQKEQKKNSRGTERERVRDRDGNIQSYITLLHIHTQSAMSADKG